MDGEYERSLLAWANTFTEAAPAASLAHFAAGDALIPLARSIVRTKDVDDDDDDDAGTGWVGVFSYMQSAGLIEEGAEVPGNNDEEKKLAVAVTCLEDLLRHTVGEDCHGRETFIRQIMSLDADVQAILRRIIVGEEPQQPSEVGSSEARSPSKDHDDACSFAGSPVAVTSSSSSGGGGGSSYEEDDDDASLKSWYSPHPRGSARRKSLVAGGRTRTGERAAPVGPKTKSRQQGRTLDMDMGIEDAEKVLVGEAAASAESESFPGAVAADVADDAAGWTATAMEVVDLKTEVSRLKAQIEETEAQREAAEGRQEELCEDLGRARQAVERLTISERRALGVEIEMRDKHEEEVAVLQERASKAEERVLDLESVENEVLRLRDKVDILRPVEAKLSKAEQNLLRFREKIEELSAFPGQLKKEEEAHARVLDRCLELEAEVSQIPQLKRQVQGYRRSHTDMETADREKSRELEMAQEKVTRLSQEVQALADGSRTVRDEQQRLQEELQSRAMEETEEAGFGAGIGEGVSELNPELTEELARLRRTNEQLLAKVDYNTEETIWDLEQKADDASRLADSFHDNLASERELRAAAETSLAAARARIAELEAELAALHEEHRRTATRMEAEAAAAGAAAAAALAAAGKESCERLAAAEQSAADALQVECNAGAERLAAAEGRAERDAEALRAEMVAAAEAAAVAAAKVEGERGEERAEFQAQMAAAKAAAAREEERVAAELAAAEQRRDRERKEMEDVINEERQEAARKEEEAARELVAARQTFESEVAEMKEQLDARLEEERRSAADEVAVEKARTAREEAGRLEESRLKDEAKQEVLKLEKTLSAGKKAAFETIGRLETNAREQRAEAAALQQEMLLDHEAKMAALNGEFQQYRETHTVDDLSYNNDLDKWEMSIATKQRLIADLQARVDALEKDKRRLEREKTYYWGQAEELRMSAAAGGRADPSRDAEHVQLVEQTRELIEENRELRQRAQDGGGGGGGGMNTRSGGRWGNSGVAAMRAEHEAEMTALKEEKQDMLLKYHAASSKLNEQERRCAELQGEVEETRTQVRSLQLENKRQEKKLRDSESSAAVPPSVSVSVAVAGSKSKSNEPSTRKEKENQDQDKDKDKDQTRSKRITTSARANTRGRSKSKGRASASRNADAPFDDGDAPDDGGGDASTGATARGQRGPLRGLGNARQPQHEENHGKVKISEKERGLEGDDETPPECVQS